MNNSAREQLGKAYETLWGCEKHDSPDFSRLQLARILRNYLLRLSGRPDAVKMLSVASGPQALESYLLSLVSQSKASFASFRINTIDLARIYHKKLLASRRKPEQIVHNQMDATSLQFPDNSFDVVYSNLGIDFAPVTALAEARRVLKPHGVAIFNFHHRKMLPEDLSVVKNLSTREFWSHLKDYDRPYSSVEQIMQDLLTAGFASGSIAVIKECTERENLTDHHWWHVQITPDGYPMN